MNALIKDLWDKAATASAAYPSGQYTSWETQVSFMDKFAELIVMECAESLWMEECYNSDLALEEFEKNSKKIRKHFGVEL